MKRLTKIIILAILLIILFKFGLAGWLKNTSTEYYKKISVESIFKKINTNKKVAPSTVYSSPPKIISRQGEQQHIGVAENFSKNGAIIKSQILCSNWTQVRPKKPVELILVPPHTYKEYLVLVEGGKVSFKNSSGKMDVVSGYDTRNIQSKEKNGLCRAYYHSGNPKIKVIKIF